MENQEDVNEEKEGGLDSTGLALIGLALLMLAGGIIFVVSKNNSTASSTPLPTAQGLQLQNNQTTATVAPMEQDVKELKIVDEVVGTGAEAAAGKKVTVHYTGTLTNGQKFDSSVDRGQPFSFNLGAGQVIQGWDKGVVGMKVGGKRKLVIPSDLGYGPQGSGPIPGNATLVFQVELLKVE